MKPFLSLLLDSYRGLKSETIFWITLGLSVLVAVIFLSIGFDDKGISILFGITSWEMDLLSRDSPLAYLVYTGIFSNLVAGVWLTFIAIILALISCASIFPGTLDEGTAGMLMTKKPSRLQIFLAKLTGSLFFVFVQVGLFMVVVILAFRWRLGMWNFSLLWYVPAVLLVFLNLYSVMVLVGVKTKSAITSILITLLVWGLSAGLHNSIGFLSMESRSAETEYRPAVSAEGEEAKDGGGAAREPRSDTVDPPGESDGNQALRGTLETILLFLPKNGPIMTEAERKVVFDGLEEFGGFAKLQETLEPDDREAFDETINEFKKSDSRLETIGTSSLFALVMLSLAGWVFCRKEI